jgi:hypothetical protein
MLRPKAHTIAITICKRRSHLVTRHHRLALTGSPLIFLGNKQQLIPPSLLSTKKKTEQSNTQSTQRSQHAVRRRGVAIWQRGAAPTHMRGQAKFVTNQLKHPSKGVTKHRVVGRDTPMTMRGARGDGWGGWAVAWGGTGGTGKERVA